MDTPGLHTSLASLQARGVALWLLLGARALSAPWLMPSQRLTAQWVLLAWGMGHALWLAVGFALAAWLNAAQESWRRPRFCSWLRAWWGEVWASPRVFAWEQPFFRSGFPTNCPPALGGRPACFLCMAWCATEAFGTPGCRA